MFEPEKNLLVRLCQKSNSARQGALAAELTGRGVHFENWDNMALVVPSAAERVIVLCAHFDAVENSFGYNDNGMALVTSLTLLGKLPPCIEFVFTNGEEHGAVGARYYLEHCAKDIRGCINLDVVGCFDQVYLDPMNCAAARSLTHCKQGIMPLSDAYAFASMGIPSVCFSSGPHGTDFDNGIMEICSTIHNHRCDNDFSLLNFEMISKVSTEVKKMANLMDAA